MDFKRLLILGMVYSTLGLGPLFAEARQRARQIPSLGDFAREQRRKQGKDFKKPAKVYTNEDFPVHPPDEQRPPTNVAPLLVSLTSSASAQRVQVPSPVHDEVYWRLRARQIDEHYDAEITKLRGEMGRLITRRFDLQAEVFEGIDLTPPPDGLGLPPEALRLRERMREVEGERTEAYEKLQEEAFREGALPGWFRPVEPGSEVLRQVLRAEEEAKEAARREAEAQKGTSEAPVPHDEKYWRKRFAELRSRISALEAEGQRQQRELNQTLMARLNAIPQVVYASDFFYMPMLTESQNRLRMEEEELYKARQELEEAQAELLKSGGPLAWAQE